MKDGNNNHEPSDVIRFFVENEDKVSMCVERDGKHYTYSEKSGLVDMASPLDPGQAIFSRYAIAQIFLCEPTGTPWEVDIDGMVSLEDQLDQIGDNRGTDREWITVCTSDDDGIDAVVSLAHPSNANFLVNAVNMHGRLETACRNALAAMEDMKSIEGMPDRSWVSFDQMMEDLGAVLATCETMETLQMLTC